jgi:hypothetical protein
VRVHGDWPGSTSIFGPVVLLPAFRNRDPRKGQLRLLNLGHRLLVPDSAMPPPGTPYFFRRRIIFSNLRWKL